MRDKNGQTPIDCANYFDLEKILVDLYFKRRNTDDGEGRSSPRRDFGGKHGADEFSESQTQDIELFERELEECVFNMTRDFKIRLTPIFQHFLALDRAERHVVILALMRPVDLQDQRLCAEVLTRLSRGRSLLEDSLQEILALGINTAAGFGEMDFRTRNQLPTPRSKVDVGRYAESAVQRSSIPVLSGWWVCCNCQNSNNPALAPGRCAICNHEKCAPCRGFRR